jgi:signal transduction histidine kinase
MRHGGATAFYVELKEEEGVIALTVSDNGCGLPEDFKEGFGMKGIREKATAFGGGVYLESESGDGLEITVKFPTQDNQEEQENQG